MNNKINDSTLALLRELKENDSISSNWQNTKAMKEALDMGCVQIRDYGFSRNWIEITDLGLMFSK